MVNEIIADVGASQTRVALMEDHELVEFYIEDKDHKSMIGNIYSGRVTNVLPGMQAAFVDIGYEKNAFLYIHDILNHANGEAAQNKELTYKPQQVGIAELVEVGQKVLVQVIKEPMGAKGPRITTSITLPGRYLILLPDADYIGVSKRIESETERQRLKSLMQHIKPEKMGLIIRTEGEGRNEEDFEKDLKDLLKIWKSTMDHSHSIMSPGAVYEEFSLVLRVVRDLFNNRIGSFIINQHDEYMKVMSLLNIISPELKNKVYYYDKSDPVFVHYKIESKVSRMLDKKVWLKSGGYIVIDQTEALTAVDVNTGRYVGSTDLQDTILQTNMEAAVEIAKQLRLRNVGGIIIIDFIDMVEQQHREQVLEVLRNHLKKDKTKATVMGITSLGLVEMTRKKTKDRISKVLARDCPYCKGTGKVY